MFNVSTEEVLGFFENRYEAVIVISKEVRRVNHYVGEEMKEKGEKPIICTITKLQEGEIPFTYTTQEISEEKEEKEKGKEERKNKGKVKVKKE